MFNSVRTVNEASGMTWAGDCRYSFGFGEDESLWVHGFRFNESPEAFHLIPSEAYAGSRFSGTFGLKSFHSAGCWLLVGSSIGNMSRTL